MFVPEKISDNILKRHIEAKGVNYVYRIKELDLKRFSRIFDNLEFVIGFTQAIESLTDIQLKTLEQAYRNGYYSSPRMCTLDDLARMNGVSKNALIKRLKSAERKILASLFSK